MCSFWAKTAVCENLQDRKTFRGCTKTVKFFINTQFCKDKGFAARRVLAVQKQ